MKIARASTQGELFAVRPTYRWSSDAGRRNAYGCAAQDVACTALGLSPIRIDGGKDICFDAERGKTFFEVKSARQGGEVIVYDWRMAKEERAGVPAFYVVVGHKVGGVGDCAALWAGLASCPVELTVVPLGVVHELAKGERLCKTASMVDRGKRTGYNREGYREGYRRIPIKKFKAAATVFWSMGFTLFGVAMQAEIRTTWDAPGWLLGLNQFQNVAIDKKTV